MSVYSVSCLFWIYTVVIHLTQLNLTQLNKIKTFLSKIATADSVVVILPVLMECLYVHITK